MKQTTSTQPERDIEVESLVLAPDLDRKVAEATVRVGDFRINQIALWRAGNGTLHVYLPSWRWHRSGGQLTPHEFRGIVEVPEDLKKQIEAAVKAAYNARKEQQRPDVQHSGTLERS
jgi:hypothetical protein